MFANSPEYMTCLSLISLCRFNPPTLSLDESCRRKPRRVCARVCVEKEYRLQWEACSYGVKVPTKKCDGQGVGISRCVLRSVVYNIALSLEPYNIVLVRGKSLHMSHGNKLSKQERSGNFIGTDSERLEKHCLYYAAVLGASLWASWITWMPFLHVSFGAFVCPAHAIHFLL